MISNYNVQEGIQTIGLPCLEEGKMHQIKNFKKKKKKKGKNGKTKSLAYYISYQKKIKAFKQLHGLS